MTVFAFPGLKSRSAGFVPRVEVVASRLSADPNHLLTVMQLESGIDPAATNPTGGATGLIQFMPSTAKSLGTTTAQLREMKDVDQLEYVYAFYRPYAGRMKRPGDVYMVTFYPALAFRGKETVIARKGEKVYDQNKGLDVNKDGILTVGDVESKAEGAFARYSRLGVFEPSTMSEANVASKGAVLGAVAACGVALWLLRRKVGRSIARYR